MKKNFFAAVLTVATALGGYHYYNATVTENLSDIAKANIEALASLPEKSACWDTITAKDGVKTLYCGTCEYENGIPSFWSDTDECTK